VVPVRHDERVVGELLAAVQLDLPRAVAPAPRSRHPSSQPKVAIEAEVGHVLLEVLSHL
jgi:hypothetical protein